MRRTLLKNSLIKCKLMFIVIWPTLNLSHEFSFGLFTNTSYSPPSFKCSLVYVFVNFIWYISSVNSRKPVVWGKFEEKKSSAEQMRSNFWRFEECAVWTCKIVNSQIPFNADYLSLVCAILNKNLKPLNTSKLDDELVPCIICHLSKTHNHLKERIEQQI
jgi:hypothetical protein